MSDLPVPRNAYSVPEPPDARKKWLEAHVAEVKSRMFASKQALEKCEQDIEDIRNGRMKKLQYELIMQGETLKQLNEELNEVIIK